tara:strand:+ start:759 stop:1280 length:522 start_codon:yes stop_codon:yes gene_type:complete
MDSDKVLTIEGNLLDFPEPINVIAHSCNTRNIMGAGIAKQIKDRYPEAYEADTKAYDTEYDENGQYVHWLGKFSKAEINDRKYIYNMYTQASVGEGRQVSYEVFWKALKRVEQDLFQMNVNKHEYDGSAPPILGLPYGISCGLAGGSWRIIKAIIEDIFSDSPLKCYIVKYNQ